MTRVAVLLLLDDRTAEPNGSLGAGLEPARLDLAAGRGATDVERPHRELRSGLADRLGSDDNDRLADVDAVATGEISSVAEAADAAPRLTGEHAADHDLLDTCVFDLLHLELAELGVRRDEHLAG